MFTSKLQNIVLKFQQKFNHPFKLKPTLPTLERFVDRKGWGVLEEMLEQLHTLSNNEQEFDAAIDKMRMYFDKAVEKQKAKEFLTDEKEKLAALSDGLGDELWFLLGDCVEAGIDIHPIIEIIEHSNNSKMFTDESGHKYVKLDENGKIMKSPEFFAPEPFIEKEIERQLSI